jgi:hypothetical protein
MRSRKWPGAWRSVRRRSASSRAPPNFQYLFSGRAKCAAERQSRPAAGDAAAGKVTGARTLSVRARLGAHSSRHPPPARIVRATSRQLERMDGRRAVESRRSLSGCAVRSAWRTPPPPALPLRRALLAAAGLPARGRVSQADHAAPQETGRSDSSRRLPSVRSGCAHHHRRFVPPGGPSRESALVDVGVAEYERSPVSRPQRPRPRRAGRRLASTRAGDRARARRRHSS